MQNNHFSLITGASAGIGEACARELAKKGRNLLLLARRRDRLTVLAKELKDAHGVDVLCFAVDVTDKQEVDAFFEKIKGQSIDVLINNAGLARNKMPLEEYDWNDLEEMIDTNIKGFLRVAQLAIPFLKKTKGHIMNLSSIAGIETYEGGNVYCGTKAFVKMLSKAMRIDLAGSGVRVTDIAPGNVETEFSLVRYHGDAERAKKVYEGFVALKAEDIATCIAFCLDLPAHVNVEYMLVMPTAQSSAMRIARR